MGGGVCSPINFDQLSCDFFSLYHLITLVTTLYQLLLCKTVPVREEILLLMTMMMKKEEEKLEKGGEDR